MYCRLKQLITLLFAIVSIVSSFLIYFVLLAFIRQQIEESLPILNVSKSRTYPNWESIPFPIYNYLYLFNVTNADRVENLKEKPIVEQLGPYTFLERRVKQNISWAPGHTSNPHETVWYQMRRTWHFVPELTVGSLNDLVYHLNVPQVSAFNQVKQKGGSVFEYGALRFFTGLTGGTLFLKHTARELLFEGYKDPLITVANRFGANVPFDKFGWFYKKNDTASDGLFRVYTGVTDLQKIGKVFSWNGQQKSNLWTTDQCNQIDALTTAGDMFAPFQSPPPDYVNMFVGEICRPLKLGFEREETLHGVKVNRYSIQESTFDYSIEENKCYCSENGICPPKGIANTSACQLGAPVGISMPHFLYGEQSLFDNVRGMQPDPAKHRFFLDIEPVLGIPVRIAVKMQINIFLENNAEGTSNLNDHSTYYPMLWFDVKAQMDEQTAKQIRLVQNLPLYVNLMAIATLLVGTVLMVIAFRLSTQHKMPMIEKQYTSLHIITSQA